MRLKLALRGIWLRYYPESPPRHRVPRAAYPTQPRKSAQLSILPFAYALWDLLDVTGAFAVQLRFQCLLE